MKTETIVLSVKLNYDPETEDKRGSLAQVLVAMGEGIANGHTAGRLPNKGSWQIGEGENLIK